MNITIFRTAIDNSILNQICINLYIYLCFQKNVLSKKDEEVSLFSEARESADTNINILQAYRRILKTIMSFTSGFFGESIK